VSNTSAALRRYWWLLAGLAVLWVLVGLLPSNSWLMGGIALVFLTALAAAFIFPAHPLRNGTLAGILAWYLGLPIGLAVQTLRGTLDIGQGETVGSTWLELPFWLTLFLPIGIVAGFVGGLVVLLAARFTRPTAA
jgi:hypothetical protein